MILREDPLWMSISFPDGRTIITSDLAYMSFGQLLELEAIEVEPIGEHRYIVKESTT